MQLQRYSTGGASVQITELAPAGGLFPGAMAYMPDRAAVALPGLSLKHGGTNVTIVGLNGSIINSWNYRDLVVDNIAYDTSLMQIFISAYNQSSKHNAVYSVDLSGSVKLIAVVPGVVQVRLVLFSFLLYAHRHILHVDAHAHALTQVVTLTDATQVAMSAYCSVGHMFFLLLPHNLTGNSILHVQTQQGIVSAPVIVTDEIEIVAGWNPSPGACASSILFGAPTVVCRGTLKCGCGALWPPHCTHLSQRLCMPGWGRTPRARSLCPSTSPLARVSTPSPPTQLCDRCSL